MTEMHFAWALPEGWTCKRRLTRYQTSTRPRAFAVATAAGYSPERVPHIRTADSKPLQLVCPSLATANSHLQALHRADRDTHSSRTQSVQPSGPERTSSTTAAAATTAARDGAGQAAAHAASSCSEMVSHTDHVKHGAVGLNASELPLRLRHDQQHLSGHAVSLAADRQLGVHLHPDHTLAAYPEEQVHVHQGLEQRDSRLLLLLKITHAADAAELHAVLQPSWQQLGPAHTAAALQQLMKLHQEQQHLPRRQGRHQQTLKTKRQRQVLKQQQQQQQQQAGRLQPAITVDPGKQPGLVEQLGQQVLAHATQLAAAATSAGSPAAAPGAAAAASASSFTAADAADVLHAAADLQLVPPAPERLLHQLLCQALPSVGALTAARLTQLLQAGTWMLEQTQQQQQPALQALSAEPHQAVQPECSQQQQQQQAAAPDVSSKLQQQQQRRRNSGLHQLARPGHVLSPEQQHTLLEAKRQQLLQPRTPQQQRLTAPSGAVVRALQDLLQRWGQAAWQQQQQLEGVGVCLSPQLLAELLAVFLQVKLLPTATCLQQLLSLAGLASKQHKEQDAQQTQHTQVVLQQERQQQQQQQHGQGWSAAAASEVLVGLEGLLQLECNERSSSSSSRVGEGLLLPVLQQYVDQLLLLTAQTAADWQEGTAQQQGVEGAAGVGGQNQQQRWPVVVALSAVARLLVLTGTGGRPSSSSSSGSHSSAAAAAFASGRQQQQQRVLLVSPACLRVLMDVLLAAVTPFSRQQDRQVLRYQQQQPLPEAVLSCADVVLAVETTCRLCKLQQQWHHHQEQQQEQAPSGATVSATLEASSSSMVQGDNRVVKPLRFQLWLQAFVPCALHPFERLKRASAAELTAVFGLLAAHRAHLPAWWLDAAQDKVLTTVEQLCASSTAGLPAAAAVGADSTAEAATAVAEARPGALAWSSAAPSDAASAAQLLHSWAQLLQVQPRRKASFTTAAAAGTEAGAAGAGASAGAAGAGASAGAAGDGVADPPQPHFRRSSSFMQRLCAALDPVLQDMDISSLGLTAASVALLGLAQEQQQHWTRAILQAMAATAARAAGTMSQPGTPPPANAAGVVVLPAAPAAAAEEGCRLPGAALVSLLHALVALRVRPPQPLLHQLLVLLRRDMVLENGPVLVQLLMVLGRLQYRPGPEWMRVVMLRLQGRLRLLSFDQLTQVCTEAGGSCQGGVMLIAAWFWRLMVAAADRRCLSWHTRALCPALCWSQLFASRYSKPAASSYYIQAWRGFAFMHRGLQQ